jgi:hypothetical protein
MSNGIQLSTNFDLKSALPLDGRTIVENVIELNAIENKYPGLICYVSSVNKNYYLNNSNNWIEIAATEPLITNFRATNSSPSSLQICCPSIFLAGRTVETLSVAWDIIQDNITFISLTDATNITTTQSSFTYSGLNLNINNTPDFKRYTLTYGNTYITKSLFFDLVFRNRRFWGVSSDPNLNMASIAFLFAGVGSDFENSRIQSNLLEPFGEYIYLAYPERLGEGILNVNGFNTTWLKTTDLYTNTEGFQESYIIYRSNNLLTSSTLVSIS